MAKLIEKYRDGMFTVKGIKKPKSIKPTKAQIEAVNEMIRRKNRGQSTNARQ